MIGATIEVAVLLRPFIDDLVAVSAFVTLDFRSGFLAMLDVSHFMIHQRVCHFLPDLLIATLHLI